MEILTQLFDFVKNMGDEAMLILVKSRWIRFAIGLAIICWGISQIKWW